MWQYNPRMQGYWCCLSCCPSDIRSVGDCHDALSPGEVGAVVSAVNTLSSVTRTFFLYIHLLPSHSVRVLFYQPFLPWNLPTSKLIQLTYCTSHIKLYSRVWHAWSSMWDSACSTGPWLALAGLFAKSWGPTVKGTIPLKNITGHPTGRRDQKQIKPCYNWYFTILFAFKIPSWFHIKVRKHFSPMCALTHLTHIFK